MWRSGPPAKHRRSLLDVLIFIGEMMTSERITVTEKQMRRQGRESLMQSNVRFCFKHLLLVVCS